MGRHSAPGSGRPEPDRGFWVRAGAVLLVVGLVGAYLLVRTPEDDTAGTTSAAPSGSTAETVAPMTTSTPQVAPPSASAAAPTSTSPSSSANAQERPRKRPPTLRFTVQRDSWITVRVPGGRTLVSRLFRPGEKGRFDQRVLQVVNGRPSAVRFVVNGEPRALGRGEGPDIFTVRRDR